MATYQEQVPNNKQKKKKRKEKKKVKNGYGYNIDKYQYKPIVTNK